MEDVPITGLEELQRHVEQLLENPDTPVDAKLFDEVELQLTGKVSCAFPSFCRSCLRVPVGTNCMPVP